MKNGFLHKILPLLMSLILVINLILIPKIDSQAASYSAATSFTYYYQGYNYQFYFSGLVDSPENYSFDSSALDYLLQKSAEGINISVSSGIGSKISNIFSNGFSAIFNLYRNFVIATDKIVADWIVWDDIYGFEFQFTGLDSSYPGNETYGTAYGWRFIGWLGEEIDLVLDSQGMLYGSNPIGNYTFSEDQEEFGTWSIHQHDGDEIWMPSVYLGSFGDLPEPYILGKSLYFYLSTNSSFVQSGWFQVEDFTNTFINAGLNHTYGTYYAPQFMFLSPDHEINIVNVDGQTSYNLQYQKANTNIDISSVHGNFSGIGYRCGIGANVNQNFSCSFNLPYYSNNGLSLNLGSHYQNNYNGILNNSPQSGNGDIYLASFTTSPLPDPIVLPVDDPIPISDIDPNPVVFDPEPDPDPVPGIDYPVPGPVPFPVPPVPPLVSGNDDLWPELNITFDIEDDLIGLANPLINFQWPSFSSVISSFLDSIVWVSSIMTALFNGTDYSILFSVLSVFFIAASIFGLYKWWHK